MECFKIQQGKTDNPRVVELEKNLLGEDDFRKLNNEQYSNLLSLKGVVGEGNWLVLDDFICAKNAECDYIMNYFYRQGLIDGKNLMH